MRPRRLVPAAVVAAAAAATALSLPADARPAAPTFATPVVVDHFRPGNEPDVAVDGHDHSGRRFYTSSIFGSSTTMSFFYRTEDHGRTFHLVEGNAIGKPQTCPGGGDSEIQVNPIDGKLYFSDLQNLTNFSNSVSADHGRSFQTSCYAVPVPGVDRQWLAFDTNGGKNAVGDGAGDGRVYFTYDSVLLNPNENVLVLDESVDGVNYGAGCVTAGVNCPLPPAVISDSEGLPGNDLVDNTPGGKYQHTVYVVHTNASGDAAVVSYCRGPSGKKTAATVADACTMPATPVTDVNPLWHDTFPAPVKTNRSVEAFPVIAIDSTGTLYVTWAEYPLKNGAKVGPGRIMYSYSTDGAQHWSKPQRVSPPSLPTPIFPWIAAGDRGRIDIAYYAATEAKEGGAYGPDALTNTGTWNAYLDQSLDARSRGARFTHTTVSDHQVKWGSVSTQGLVVGGGPAPDRSLGDFMQVKVGVHGEAVLSYVDDTSADRNPDLTFGSGQTPPEAAGPTMSAVQSGGPSLYTSVGTVSDPGRSPYGVATDPTRKGYPDAFLSQLGSDTDAPAALDIARVTMTQADSKHLRITLTTADKHLADDLAVPPSFGGATADWMVRWAAPAYHKANGHGGYLADGNIFYVGMESTNGGAPSFFTGTTDSISTTHAKFFTYPPQTTIPGSIKGATVTWTVPLADVDNPPKGAGLYSVTGFTSTQVLPSSTAIARLPNNGVVTAWTPPNLIDQALPVSYRIGTLTPHIPGSTRPPGHKPPIATTGLPVAVPVLGLAFLGVAAIAVRRRRHSTGSQVTTR